jgi:hypothetical protein
VRKTKHAVTRRFGRWLCLTFERASRSLLLRGGLRRAGVIVRKQRAQIVAVLAFLAILLSPLLTAMTVEAETYIVIYDQEDNIVTSKVEFVGAKHYNETHAIVVVIAF